MPASVVTGTTPVRHRDATVRDMTASFVLHLQSGALADGDVCGVVEVVATGERYTVTALDELGALLVKTGDKRSGHGSDDGTTRAS